MKLKFLIVSLLLGASISVFAQGVKDGIDFYNIGDYENAKVILDRNAASASNQAEVDYYYGMLALANKKTDEAKSYFDKGVAANPNYPYNFVGQGQLVLASGNKSGAKELFDKARKLSKKDAKLETAIIRAYHAVDPAAYTKEIEKSMQNARKWNVNCPDLDIYEGDCSSEKEDWGSAAGHYEMAMSHEPGNVEATVKYANTYYKVNPDWAISSLRTIIDANSNSALAQRQFAEKLYEHGDFAEAAERYGKYIASSNNYFAKDEARYAQLLYFADKYQECYDESSKLKASIDSNNPYYIPSCRMMLYSLVSLSKFDEAVTIGKEMFSYKNDSNADLYNLKDCLMYAIALENAKQPEEAVKYYNMAIEMQPENMELARRLAKQYAAAKNYEQALKFETKVVESEKVKTSDYTDMASIYNVIANDANTTPEAKQEAIDNGIKYADKVLAENAKDFTALYYKACLQGLTDTKTAGGHATESWKQLVDVINEQADTTPYKNTVIYACSYIVNNSLNKDNATALKYAQEWAKIEPDNAQLTALIAKLSK